MVAPEKILEIKDSISGPTHSLLELSGDDEVPI